MIPLKLELKNFMAYRDPDALDFEGLHTVALTGENGAGKSTLLDAVTWAIWGQARARRDDELISQGEADARVALTFSEGRNVYRVVRTRKLGKATGKGKAPTSSGTLDFFVDDDGAWRTLTEPNARETQAKIERTLNLSYDTFINSAYLKQGRADEFTLKTPAERKALLAEILSLDIWQDYERQLKDKLDVAQREQASREGRLRDMDAEIARLPEYERELEAAHAAADTAQVQLTQIETALAELNRQREQARALEAQANQHKTRARNIRTALAALRDDADKHRAVMADFEAALSQRDDIARGFAEYEATVAANDAMNLKLTSLVELNARKSKAEHEIADARRVIETERDGLARQIGEASRLADDAALRAQFAETTSQLETLLDAQKSQESYVEYLTALRQQEAELRGRNDLLRREMDAINKRIRSLPEAGALCPTCGRPLGDEEHAHVLDAWNIEGKARGDEFRNNKAELEARMVERKQQEDKAATFEQLLRRLPGVQREHAAIEQRLKQAGEASEKIAPLQERWAQLERTLHEAQFAPTARAALTEVVQELNVLGYDANAHKHLREVVLIQLRPFVDRKNKLDRAELGVQVERAALADLAGREKTTNDELATIESSIAECEQQLAELGQKLSVAANVEASHARARNEFFAAQRKVGEANQKVQACKALEGTRRGLVGEVMALRHHQGLLSELRDACSKNGVPALIVETILPQLEANANDLLGRMSNGRMNVRFETQRTAQSGNVSETLDLRISDELGERAYEMFSGGEAFRINFAVRIALSKLLAHRAGARLQTLFVDEGFGTQDAQGRERLVDAIRAIERDFERVFVITHIDELRDQFPNRIEVSKSARGSIARIV